MRMFLSYLLVWLLAWIAPSWLDWITPAYGAAPSQYGPYQIRQVDYAGYAPTDTSLYVEIVLEIDGSNPRRYVPLDLNQYGGIEWNNLRTDLPESVRRFRIIHPKCTFEDVVFVRRTVSTASGDATRSVWLAQLDNTNVAGVTLDSGAGGYPAWLLNVSEMVCMYAWDGMRIWNGYPNVFCFTTDDGADDNMDYLHVLDKLRVKWSAYIFPEGIGQAGRLTHAMLDTLVSSGVEIGSHTSSHRHTADYRYGWRRLRPYQTSVNQLAGNPSASFAYNVDDQGRHDGMATTEACWVAGTFPRSDTYNFSNMPVAADTLNYGALDSIIVWAVWKPVGASVTDTLAASPGTVSFNKSYNTTPSPSFTTAGVALSAKSDEWQTVRTKITVDGSSKPLYWTNVINWIVGPRVLAAPTVTLYCTQFWMDIHYGDIDGPKFSEDGMPLLADIVKADSTLAYEVVDSKVWIEDRLRPFDTDYACRGYAWTYNIVDAKSLNMVMATYDYARAGAHSGADLIGLRDGTNVLPNWWDLQRYEIGRAASITNIVGASAEFTLAQVDSAVQSYLDTRHDLAPLSKNGGLLERSNLMFVILSHTETEATAEQIEQIIKTVKNDGRYWVTSLGDAVDYWMKARNRGRYAFPR